MPKYRCTTGGLVLNDKSMTYGKVYDFDENPAPQHFVLVEDEEQEPIKKRKVK